MSDIYSKHKRSEIMSKISGKNTKPEIKLRKALHKEGFRYRLNKKELPGKPDIVLTKYKTVIFIHGCFWHGHKGCSKSKLPTTNFDFWKNKIGMNIRRDENVIKELNVMGWKHIIVWQCEIRKKDISNIVNKIIEALNK